MINWCVGRLNICCDSFTGVPCKIACKTLCSVQVDGSHHTWSYSPWTGRCYGPEIRNLSNEGKFKFLYRYSIAPCTIWYQYHLTPSLRMCYNLPMLLDEPLFVNLIIIPMSKQIPIHLYYIKEFKCRTKWQKICCLNSMVILFVKII